MALCRKSVLSGALGGLVASSAIWLTAHLSRQSTDDKSVSQSETAFTSLNDVFLLHKGKNLTPQQLSDKLKNQFSRAMTLRDQAVRDAQLQFFKEADKIARLHLLETQHSASGSSENAEEELLAHEEATTQDARLLYEASDPSAPREGFAPVKDQLVGYLNEVRRREALEQWSNGLREKGEWSLLVRRPSPLPELSSVDLRGLPAEGKSQPNALVFVDYLCTDCVSFYVDFAKLMAEHTGMLKPVYVPFPYTRPEVSMSLARGSLCAQQLGEFPSFHMAALTKGELLPEVSVFDLARQTGAKLSDFKSCYKSGEGLTDLLLRAQGLARQFGLMQTPAVVFQGQLLEGTGIIQNLAGLLKAASQQEQLTKRNTDNKRRGSSQP
ncbi:MAG: hypothetical protein RL189_1038 [Pseudomonadota bacterium]